MGSVFDAFNGCRQLPNDLVVKAQLQLPDAPIGLGAMTVRSAAICGQQKILEGECAWSAPVNTCGSYDFQGRRFSLREAFSLQRLADSIGARHQGAPDHSSG